MTWTSRPPPRVGSRLSPPDDGIQASLRPRGWLANRWQSVLDAFPKKHQGRLGNGRGYARSGRVRDLWFSPGLANAEVWDTDKHLVSVRVRVLEERVWDRVAKLLTEDLRLVGRMLEGDLPEELLVRLDKLGVHLMPTPDDLGGDCDCGDFLLPCEHMAAVHHLLADALDGDPFLLPTLRGRTRDQLLARLRAAWDDDRPLHPPPDPTEEEPPEGDWLTSPGGMPRLSFRIRPGKSAGLGLRSLGPAPGGGDLDKALLPLYEAGAEAAARIAFGEEGPRPTRIQFKKRSAESSAADPANAEGDVPPAPGTQELTERLVDTLADLESAKSGELAKKLGLDPIEVRNELLALEKLGIVFRTGKTRGTRWWLG